MPDVPGEDFDKLILLIIVEIGSSISIGSQGRVHVCRFCNQTGLETFH
jgi:hypothetical protein